MNEYLLAFALGIIEGLTEFLPVSSTAHLRITQALLGIDLSDGYWKMFAIVIQLGAVLCLPIYFCRRIASFFATFPRGIRGDRTAFNHPLTLTLLAFVCTTIPSFLLMKTIGENLESVSVMAYSLIIGGVVMWVADGIYGGRSESGDVEDIRHGQAIWIGLCQSLSAVYPGASRSMVTITAGEIAGLSRTAALEFSFLLSMPTMAAATGYQFLEAMQNSEQGSYVGGLRTNADEITVLAIGFTVSFLVAWGVVAWFMHWVRRHGFVPFAIYRILLGIAMLLWL